MAKDGTMRGGARIGAGKKRKSLEEKITEGKATPFEIKDDTNFSPPKPKEYLTAKETCAAEVYAATFEWLKAHGCAEVVTPQLVENYSQTIGRHIQCEKILSSEGLIGEHPTTGAPIASPFVKMSLDYLKSAQQLWYQIWQIARENAVQGAGDSANDEMENILRLVK